MDRWIDSYKKPLVVAGFLGLLAWRYDLWSAWKQPLFRDSYFYDTSALALKIGLGFSYFEGGKWRPHYGYTPGYPLLLAIIYRLLPTNEPLSSGAIRVVGVVLVQSIMALSVVVIYWRVGKILGMSRQARWLWAIIYLIYVPAIISSFSLLAETTLTWLLALIIGLSFKAGSGKTHWQFWMGVCLGGLVLVKPYMVYVPIVYWLTGIMGRGKRTKFKSLALLAGVILVLMTWELRTYFLVRRWVPLQAGLKYVVAEGSYPQAASAPVGDKNKLVVWIERGWWFSVHKPRQLMMEPAFRPEIQARGRAWIWPKILMGMEIEHGLMWLVLGLGLGLGKYGQAWRLVWKLWGIALVVHISLWSEPRYLLPLIPLFWLAGIHGITTVSLKRLNKMTMGEWMGKSLLLAWLAVVVVPIWGKIGRPSYSWEEMGFPFVWHRGSEVWH